MVDITAVVGFVLFVFVDIYIFYDSGDNWQHFSLPSTDMVLGNVTKSEKRRIKQAKEEIFLEIREDKAQQDKATAENIGLDIPVAIKEILKQANDELVLLVF